MSDPQWYAPPGAQASPASPYGGGPGGHAPQAEAAGFWIRAGARIIDTISGAVVGAAGGFIAAILLAVAAGAGLGVDAGWEQRLGGFSLAPFVIGAIGTLLYHAFAESMGGATVGKLVCGLRVLREDDTPASFGAALVRSLGYYIDAFFFGAVAWSVMAKSPRQQRLGDQWAKTVVVRSSTVPEASARNPALGLLLGLFAQGAVLVIGTVLRAL
jgi:uncharacterized RDD family membrane protein YckC